MKKWIALLLVAGFLTSCKQSEIFHSSKFHDDGRAKPVVALVPIFDSSEAEMPWSLSDELTYTLHNRLVKKGNLCISNKYEVQGSMSNFVSKNNPFGEDLSWMHQAFQGNEFVVFAELIEHTITAKETEGKIFSKFTPSCELSMTMRLRVIDIRSPVPKVILQELIHDSHSVPKQSLQIDASNAKWKSKTYVVSPIGFSHYKFSNLLVKRLEDYILLAKSQ